MISTTIISSNVEGTFTIAGIRAIKSTINAAVNYRSLVFGKNFVKTELAFQGHLWRFFSLLHRRCISLVALLVMGILRLFQS